MTYGKFASLYDQLMQDAPYHNWTELVVSKKEQYQISGKDLLDLGCGTGELSVRFAKEGFRVTGVDLSDDMLAVAHAKSIEHGHSIHFLQQNMAELEAVGEFDFIVIFCDSLNYLQTEAEVLKTFNEVHQHLKKDGLFMFDVHSIFKVEEIFIGQTFAQNDEQVSFIWNCYEGEEPYSVEHELTFFTLEDSGSYSRFDELHIQRTYEVSQYKDWLKEAGFEILEVFADFENDPPNSNSERIFFICKKSS